LLKIFFGGFSQMGQIWGGGGARFLGPEKKKKIFFF